MSETIKLRMTVVVEYETLVDVYDDKTPEGIAAAEMQLSQEDGGYEQSIIESGEHISTLVEPI